MAWYTRSEEGSPIISGPYPRTPPQKQKTMSQYISSDVL